MSTTTVTPVPAASLPPAHVSFLARIEGLFHRAATEVNLALTKLLGASAAKQLETGITAALKTTAGGVITSIVAATEAAMPGASGPDKHASALAAIKTSLLAAGHTVETLGTATLDTLISGAVSLANQSGVPVTLPPTTAVPPVPPAVPPPPVTPIPVQVAD